MIGIIQVEIFLHKKIKSISTKLSDKLDLGIIEQFGIQTRSYKLVAFKDIRTYRLKINYDEFGRDFRRAEKKWLRS